MKLPRLYLPCPVYDDEDDMSGAQEEKGGLLGLSSKALDQLLRHSHKPPCLLLYGILTLVAAATTFGGIVLAAVSWWVGHTVNALEMKDKELAASHSAQMQTVTEVRTDIKYIRADLAAIKAKLDKEARDSN